MCFGRESFERAAAIPFGLTLSSRVYVRIPQIIVIGYTSLFVRQYQMPRI